MPRYTATFADGTTITRNSERAYTAAWRATWNKDGRIVSFTGFSVSADKVNADKPDLVGVFGSPKQKAEAKRKNAEYREACGYRVEIVPAAAA